MDTVPTPTHLIVALVLLLLARTDVIQDATFLPRNDNVLIASPALLDAAMGPTHTVDNISHQVPVWDVSILVHRQVQRQVTQIAHRLKCNINSLFHMCSILLLKYIVLGNAAQECVFVHTNCDL